MFPFAAAIFISAFLLFLVQPMMGKYLLPWFGGGAGVWSACLLFFQVMLLAGYAYAHLINRRLSPRGQAIVHSLVMLAALAFLPIVPADAWKPQGDDSPALRIVVLLAVCLGGPYVALAATGPLLQAWFARAQPGRSPYRLYALSNVGSLLALLGYPMFVEPRFSRHAAAVLWSGGFGLYVIACGACAFMMLRRSSATPATAPPADRADDSDRPITGFHRAMWIILPMLGTILLMSFTARLSEEVAPVPMLWIVPLAVYLMTFIIAFEYPEFYRRGPAIVALLAAYGLISWLIWYYTTPIIWQVAGYSAAMFVCCMVCHGETYRLRPAASGLTGYYLAVAGGGALGGAFVSLLAPQIFTFNLEFYLGLFGTFAAFVVCVLKDPQSWFVQAKHRTALVGLCGLALAGAVIMWRVNQLLDPSTFMRLRSFYGTLAVGAPPVSPGHPPVHVLTHGRVVHGVQFIDQDPQALRFPTTYYGFKSGVGIVLQNWPETRPRRVGLVGMGIGTLATYGRPGDVYRFYEINPQVIDVARSEYFAFVNGSPAEVQIVQGDGRLALEREDPQHFDILVLDAFSGDAIPVHLLTREAFAIYQKHLNGDGAILINASNSFIRLDLALARLAMDMGWEARRFLAPDDHGRMILASRWVLITKNHALLEQPAIKSGGIAPDPSIRRMEVWTDDHTNLLEVMH